MLKSVIRVKSEETPVFQVLFLDNDPAQGVEVQEAEQVDFRRVQEYLKNGGSIFITSKQTQQLIMPKKKKINRNATSAVYYIDHM